VQTQFSIFCLAREAPPILGPYALYAFALQQLSLEFVLQNSCCNSGSQQPAFRDGKWDYLGVVADIVTLG